MEIPCRQRHAVGGQHSENYNWPCVRVPVASSVKRVRAMQFRGHAMKLPHRRQFLQLAAGAVALPVVSRFAWAQAYPSRPVRIIVGVAAGSAPDIFARLIGQWLSERLGNPFVVENRSGGGGNIATEAVANSQPDGYTLLMVATNDAINATLYEKLSFNFIRDIAPVASMVLSSNVMVVHPSVPAKTVPDCSPMPGPIRARSTWRRPASGPRPTLPASCLR